MATNFPTSLDAFTNPTAVDTLDSPPHDVQHADANDAIEALQAKVGVDGSAVTDSLDYKVANFTNKLGSDAAVRTLGSFVGGDVLQAAELNAIGTWTSFTPTWKFGANAITGTSVGRYVVMNKVVTVQVYLAYTSKAGGGDLNITIPSACSIGALASNYRLGYGSMYDSNLTTSYAISAYNEAVSSTVFKFLDDTEGFIVSDTAPFTWATGDEMFVTLIGEKA